MNFPGVTDITMLTDPAILLTGIAVFAARIFDVSIGTVRTIATVQGRTVLSFCLAVFEVTIWISVVSTVIHKVQTMPILVVFYSLGYATGNVVGILVEKRLAFGVIILKVFSSSKGTEIAKAFRATGQAVTVFHGEGMKGPVQELYIACRRKELKHMLPRVTQIDDKAFYVIEQAQDVKKTLTPIMTPLGGWRQRNNRK